MRFDVVDHYSLLVIAINGEDGQVRDHPGKAFLKGLETLNTGGLPDG
ncbi:hypothetical protein D083_3527 [Dickeya solani RNS 08.23.3.1.A]|nr:hypothetical protein D083_3527 [Dickeya solani RNS 08.23.3.1.A]